MDTIFHKKKETHQKQISMMVIWISHNIQVQSVSISTSCC